jgi:uncharacterized membrane protein YgdD (TMEM256/DUF423 family)
MTWLERIAALWMALSIAAGAFAAHGASAQQADWLRTGALYAMVHGLAVLILARRALGPSVLMLAGSVIFALTLYAMAFGAPRWFGAITPIGGVCMIAGWLWLAAYRVSSRNTATSASDTDLST